MFSDLDISQKAIIYEGLIRLVQSNSGIGFHNSDQGHPAYEVGMKGIIDYDQWGDSPENNRLFKMITSLAQELVTDESTCPKCPVITWEDFCTLAYAAYEKYPPTQYPRKGFEDLGSVYGEVKP